jgi:hypothetical protein
VESNEFILIDDFRIVGHIRLSRGAGLDTRGSMLKKDMERGSDGDDRLCDANPGIDQISGPHPSFIYLCNFM